MLDVTQFNCVKSTFSATASDCHCRQCPLLHCVHVVISEKMHVWRMIFFVVECRVLLRWDADRRGQLSPLRAECATLYALHVSDQAIPGHPSPPTALRLSRYVSRLLHNLLRSWWLSILIRSTVGCCISVRSVDVSVYFRSHCHIPDILKL